MASTDAVIVRATDCRACLSDRATAVSALDGVTIEGGAASPRGMGLLAPESQRSEHPCRTRKPDARIGRVDGATFTMDECYAIIPAREKVGMIFQAFNLLPAIASSRTSRCRSCSPGVAREARLERARAVLDSLGMGPRGTSAEPALPVARLQRTAIARASSPIRRLLLADEPTGNLDSANGEALLALIAELHARGQTWVLVTHDAGSRRARSARCGCAMDACQ